MAGLRAPGDSPLSHGLKSRHVLMITLGSVIGGGLFVGSATAIRTIGPGALVAYAVGALLVVLVMRMLAEMAVERPASGSWSEYAQTAFGRLVGFVSGWLYWYLWVVTMALEATIGAQILTSLTSVGPAWLVSLVLLLALAAANLLAVSGFGELEFWLSSIKLLALLGFVVVAGLALAGLIGGPGASPARMLADGGPFPFGANAVLSGISTLIFVYGGVEIGTIAAAEARDPVRAIRRASALLVWRVGVLYIGTLALLMCVVPWRELPTDRSPFGVALDALGVAGGSTILDVVILTAVLSVLNAGLYIASRMTLSLGTRGHAPDVLTRVDARGVPVRAVCVTTVATAAVVGIAYLSPGDVFVVLTSSIGAVMLVDYLIIAVTHVRLRRRRTAAPALAMWLFPWLTYATVVALAAVLVSMAFIDTLRQQLLYTLLALVVISALGVLRR